MGSVLVLTAASLLFKLFSQLDYTPSAFSPDILLPVGLALEYWIFLQHLLRESIVWVIPFLWRSSCLGSLDILPKQDRLWKSGSEDYFNLFPQFTQKFWFAATGLPHWLQNFAEPDEIVTLVCCCASPAFISFICLSRSIPIWASRKSWQVSHMQVELS